MALTENAVVGVGDTLCSSPCSTAFHFLLVQHTAAAVYNQLIRGQIFRKAVAGGKVKLKAFPGVTLYPFRQLYRADVVALAVVGAALRDEDAAAIRDAQHCLPAPGIRS